MAKAETNTRLQVIARAPFEVYFEGEADVLSAENPVGIFDILPGHADFFSVLVPCEVIIDAGTAEPVKFRINNGMITVRDNNVMLFVNM